MAEYMMQYDALKVRFYSRILTFQVIILVNN